MNNDAIRAAVLINVQSLVDARGEIVCDDGTRTTLKLAQVFGLARPRPDGGMRMRETPGDNVKLLGATVPVFGALYEIWELQGEAKEESCQLT